MKFRVLYKDCYDVRRNYYHYRVEGYGNGAELKKLKCFLIRDAAGRLTDRRALAYCCEGSPLSYLWHKIKMPTTVMLGWGD